MTGGGKAGVQKYVGRELNLTANRLCKREFMRGRCCG